MAKQRKHDERLAAERDMPAEDAELVMPGNGSGVQGGWFVFGLDDPFVAGVLRHAGLGKPTHLPVRLNLKDEATASMLGDYIFRAAGGGRMDLAEKAQAALDRIAK